MSLLTTFMLSKMKALKSAATPKSYRVDGTSRDSSGSAHKRMRRLEEAITIVRGCVMRFSGLPIPRDPVKCLGDLLVSETVGRNLKDSIPGPFPSGACHTRT